jgi:hypothetical protein
VILIYLEHGSTMINPGVPKFVGSQMFSAILLSNRNLTGLNIFVW